MNDLEKCDCCSKPTCFLYISPGITEDGDPCTYMYCSECLRSENRKLYDSIFAEDEKEYEMNPKPPTDNYGMRK